MFKTFHDNCVGNRPYKVFFASGDWTCSIAQFYRNNEGANEWPERYRIVWGRFLYGRALE